MAFRKYFGYARRYVGKYAKKVGMAAKKRYFKGKGYRRPKIGRMAQDVANIARVINAEKKQLSQNISATGIGSPTAQAFFQAITNITEGTARNNRLGESCKIVSWVLEYQFVQQASCTNNRYIKLWFVQYKNNTGAVPTISNFLDEDMNGNRGYSSIRNPDHFREFRVMGTKTIYLKNDDLTGESVQKQGRIYGKCEIHQRYTSTTPASLIWGQFYIIAVVHAGNTTSSTGVDGSFRINQFFYDN